MRSCLAFVAALIPAGCGPVPAKISDGIIRVELRVMTPVVKKGEPPQLVVEVVNVTDHEITLVQPGDGSELGWRTPVVRWQVDGHGPPDVGLCGNINPLTADEVFTLTPGQRATLGGWVGQPYLPKAGKYRVWVRYENTPDLECYGWSLEPHDPAAIARVRASTPAVGDSNTVVIEVADDKER
jgi:hypothetical protein